MLDDVYRYVEEGVEDRVLLMERMLRWRLVAPTAPDTLWSYPFQDIDQFIIEQCPNVFFMGNQPEFGTRVITGPEGQSVRLISVPKFCEKAEMVLLDLETLEVEVVSFKSFGE